MLGNGALGQFALGEFGRFSVVGGWGSSDIGTGKPVRKKRVFPIVEEPTAKSTKKAKKRSLPQAVVADLRARPFHIESVLPPAKSQITRELLDRWFEQEAVAKLLKEQKALDAKAKEDLLAEAKVAHKERLDQEEEMLLVSFLAAYYRSLR